MRAPRHNVQFEYEQYKRGKVRLDRARWSCYEEKMGRLQRTSVHEATWW